MTTKSNFLQVNGAEIYFQDRGSGFPIVLVHAGIAHSEMWDPQVEYLAENYRVITYDLRGFGKSNPVPGKFAHYLDLVSILNQLEIDRCILIGCSKGGGVVLDAALAAPEKVAGLVVVAGIAHGLELDEEPIPPPQWEEAVKAFQDGDLARTNELEVQMWMDGYGQPVGRAEQHLREKIRQMNEIALKNEKAAVGATETVLEPKAGGRLGELSAPVFFIHGDLDEPIIIPATHKMVAEIPQASQVVIRDTAHLPNLEKPAEFNQLIGAFIFQNQQS